MGPNDLAQWLKLINEGGPLALFGAIVGGVIWAVTSTKKIPTQSPLATKADVEKVADKIDGIDSRVSRLEGRLEGWKEGQGQK